MKRRFGRLSPSDLSNLRLETLSSPFHFGALLTVDGPPLLDVSGRLRTEEITDRFARRLSRVPQLRRRLCFPGVLRGRALWVDDVAFDIRRHIRVSEVDAPGGDAALLETGARLYGRLLDRSLPLWELWFLTGVSGNRLGVLLKLHHSVADGAAAMAIMGVLFDIEADAPEPAAAAWSPAPAPGGWPLLIDNLSTKVAAVGHATGVLVHPGRVAAQTRASVRDTWRTVRRHPAAARTSINQPVQPGRRIRFVQLDLAAARERAHAAGAKVNDLVLDLVAGGLRELLIDRGELVEGLVLTGTVAVSLRNANEAPVLGNQVGVVMVPLPVDEADPDRRLQTLAAATREAKSHQRPRVAQALVERLAATPIAQRMMARQRWVNVFSTNLVGPSVPIYVLGARVIDVIPIIQVAGNVGLAFCAISYAGRLFVVVTADATACPDIDVVSLGMERTWRELGRSGVPSATVG